MFESFGLCQNLYLALVEVKFVMHADSWLHSLRTSYGVSDLLFLKVVSTCENLCRMHELINESR